MPGIYKQDFVDEQSPVLSTIFFFQYQCYIGLVAPINVSPLHLRSGGEPADPEPGVQLDLPDGERASGGGRHRRGPPRHRLVRRQRPGGGRPPRPYQSAHQPPLLSGKFHRVPTPPPSSTRRKAGTLIKKRTKFSSYIRKFRWDPVQSHI